MPDPPSTTSMTPTATEAQKALEIVRELFPSLCGQRAYCRHEPCCHAARRVIKQLEEWANA